MKNIHITPIIAFTIAGLITGGCEKNIDLIPSDSIDQERALQDVDDLKDALTGAYATLSYDNSLYVGSIMADEVRWAEDNSSRNFGLIHKWSFSASPPIANSATAAWTNLYQVIDQVNRVLNVIDEIPGEDAGEEADKALVKGELLALRAFAHFESLRFYAPQYENDALGVPIMLVSEISKPARSTFGEVISQARTDLNEAKQLIPASYSDLSRFTQTAITALQARMALYTQNWDEAIGFANDVLQSKGVLLSGNDFLNIWNDSDSTETIFQLRRNSPTGYVNTLWTDQNNDVFFSPSFKLINTYDQEDDIRYQAYVLHDLDHPTREKWMVNKYPGQGDDPFNNVKVFRNAEMYLILAEAYAETERLSDGAEALNMLRTARINGYTNETFSTSEELIEAVYMERFKELVCEGHRFFDLRRRQLSITRTPEDVALANDIPLTLMPDDRNYILPILQAELQANENMVQNPGYSAE